MNKHKQGEVAKQVHREFALLRAANGMPTEEAVKYIEHGREMVKSLRTHCNACFRQNEGVCDRAQHSNCRTNRLLTKLEAK